MVGFDDFPDIDSDVGEQGVVDATVPEPMDDADGITSQTLDPMGVDQDLVNAQPEGQPAPEPKKEDVKPQRSQAVERRFSRLTRRLKEGAEESAVLHQQNEVLRQRIELLEAQARSGLHTSAGAGRPAGGDFLAGLEEQNGGQGDEAKIAAAVQRALQPVLTKLESYEKREADTAKTQQLRQEQQSSYRVAVEEFPELAKTDTQISQAANRLYLEDPGLQADPNGPYKAALMARGILAEEARMGLSTAPKKQVAASVNNPASAPTRKPVNRQQVLASLRDRCTPEDWLRVRKQLREADAE